MYTNTKSKGDEAELQILLKLKRLGYAVSIPFGENQPYDLVVETPKGGLHRVQVRWVGWKKDVLEVPLRIVSKNYHRTLDLKRVDWFAVWDGEDAFFISTSEMKGLKAAFSIRREAPKNGQKKRIRYAEDYRLPP